MAGLVREALGKRERGEANLLWRGKEFLLGRLEKFIGFFTPIPIVRGIIMRHGKWRTGNAFFA